MYNHQGKYARAISRLYRNRADPESSAQSQGTEWATSLGSSIQGMAAGQSKGLKGRQEKAKLEGQKAQMAGAIDYQTKQRDMSDAIWSQYMADNIQRAQMEDAIQQGVMQSAQDQLQRQRTAEAAQMAPFGGRFSATGYQDHVKQSDKYAQDIHTSKRLIGMGGSFPRDPNDL